MNCQRVIQIRVTRNQYERIVNNAQAKGYATLSAYLRDLALNKDLSFQMKLNEIYSMLSENGEAKKRENKNISLKAFI